MLSFILKDIDKTYGEKVKIIKVDFEENPDLIEEHDVEGYPTLIMFKDGRVSRKAGLQQKPVIINMIRRLCNYGKDSWL